MIHLFLKMARKVDDAADFVFVQLTEQEPGIHDKRYQDYPFFFHVAPTLGSLLPLLEHRAEFPQFLD
jgi:hypothetical protein